MDDKKTVEAQLPESTPEAQRGLRDQANVPAQAESAGQSPIDQDRVPLDLVEGKSYQRRERDTKDCKPCGPIHVTLDTRKSADADEDIALNSVIRQQMMSTGFVEYQNFMNKFLENVTKQMAGDALIPFKSASAVRSVHSPNLIKLHGSLAYDVLRMATEAFLLTRCGPACEDYSQTGFNQTVREDAKRLGFNAPDYEARVTTYLGKYINSSKHEGTTPYLKLIVEQLLKTGRTLAVPAVLDSLYTSRFECPEMIELIWSYWHEEGMLSQTMNAIGIRFQNRRSRAYNDPLAALEIDPLRPLSNLLWGWIQSEHTRLTVSRRAYEYDHHYGFPLLGKAVPQLLSADSRSKFLEAFHNLLYTTHVYYQERSNTTIIPDGFPLLNALREVHLILAEGAHNQYGDLPWTSRVEMLIEQWLLARPEMREFLRGRAMVPYKQTWMGQVDTMKKLQSWTDVTVTHFHELATCGEAILLSVRHGPWATTNNQANATAWADFWRPEIQRYIHAYKAATGCDLAQDQIAGMEHKRLDKVMPAKLLLARLQAQNASMAAS